MCFHEFPDPRHWIKNCFERGLNETSGFVSDTSGLVVKRESMKPLGATPLNSESQCQKKAAPMSFWHTAREKWCTGSMLFGLLKSILSYNAMWSGVFLKINKFKKSTGKTKWTEITYARMLYVCHYKHYYSLSCDIRSGRIGSTSFSHPQLVVTGF